MLSLVFCNYVGVEFAGLPKFIVFLFEEEDLAVGRGKL
jgi:hypothetical protein